MPFSACRLVMAADSVVCEEKEPCQRDARNAPRPELGMANLSVIDMANGSNIYMRLGSLVDGVCSADIQDR